MIVSMLMNINQGPKGHLNLPPGINEWISLLYFLLCLTPTRPKGIYITLFNVNFTPFTQESEKLWEKRQKKLYIICSSSLICHGEATCLN